MLVLDTVSRKFYFIEIYTINFQSGEEGDKGFVFWDLLAIPIHSIEHRHPILWVVGIIVIKTPKQTGKYHCHMPQSGVNF